MTSKKATIMRGKLAEKLSNRSTRYCPFCIPKGRPSRKDRAQNIPGKEAVKAGRFYSLTCYCRLKNSQSHNITTKLSKNITHSGVQHNTTSCENLSWKCPQCWYVVSDGVPNTHNTFLGLLNLRNLIDKQTVHIYVSTFRHSTSAPLYHWSILMRCPASMFMA